MGVIGDIVNSGVKTALSVDLATAAATKIMDASRLPNGKLSIAGLAAGISSLGKTDQMAAQLARAAIETRLTPVERGQLTAALPTVAKELTGVASPKSAPTSIRFDVAMTAEFNAQWAKSFPVGKSKEQGGTITFALKTGVISIQNIGGKGSTSGSFSPDMAIDNAKKDGALGVFHTHPYDKAEGSHVGVSLSGGDAAYMINAGQNIIVAQSGKMLFAYVRTAQTPKSVDFTKVDSGQNARIAELTAKGYNFARASQLAARETAVAFNLAYYEGTNGNLKRISP